jgi:predicted DNA-binding WGR domain protein
MAGAGAGPGQDGDIQISAVDLKARDETTGRAYGKAGMLGSSSSAYPAAHHQDESISPDRFQTLVGRSLGMRREYGMSNLIPSIDLERRQPERNMARFYSLSVERDLFGVVLSRRCWGRIGTAGRTLSEPHPTTEATWTQLRQLEQAKRRRGYVDRS